MTALMLRMTHGAAITGTIVDTNGRPADVVVSVLQQRFERGERRVVPLNGLGPNITITEAITDDRGAYRLFGLPPGDYVISASSWITSRNSSRERGAAPRRHPRGRTAPSRA